MTACRAMHGMDRIMAFEWYPDQLPPTIESHSKAKLRVLRSYLRAYFDRLNRNPSRDVFRLDLVDGFAGGGIFLDNGAFLSGSPLIMLEEASSARERLNRNRKKLLSFDCKFYFVDKETAHTDHLRKTLEERGYKVDEDRIVVRNGLFDSQIEAILHSIHSRQPRAGRAIFLLDQTGYSQVELKMVSRIFAELPAAEVILTFAADALVNILSKTPHFEKAVVPVQLSNSQIQDLIQSRDKAGGRALVQRLLRDQVRKTTGAKFDTAFFIRPRQSRRALWFLHLSNHPTARNVMIERHWENENTFEHYGHGGIGMLGYDSLQDHNAVPLFNFRQDDREQMCVQLLDSIPGKIHALASEHPVTVNETRCALANETAASFFDLDLVILQLAKGKELDILNSTGEKRSRSLTRLKPTDRISLPPTPMLINIPGR